MGLLMYSWILSRRCCEISQRRRKRRFEKEDSDLLPGSFPEARCRGFETARRRFENTGAGLKARLQIPFVAGGLLLSRQRACRFSYLVVGLLKRGQDVQSLLGTGFQIVIHQGVDEHGPPVCPGHSQAKESREKPTEKT